ncbi:MAG: ROK family protein [Acidobacteriota bacterium]|nr:ROK family protein [Acidobacteriota bacterium]
MYAGIEAGGTNFVCGVGTGPEDLVREEFATGPPKETIARAGRFFSGFPVTAIGMGCFGPIDRAAGRITNTPKTAWQQFAVVEALREATGISRIAFDTDVNAAALGEHRWGAAVGIADFLYLTVGTGIGGGAMVNGALLHGHSHPEMGHIRIARDTAGDPFPGVCYAHGDCLEGLACGVAIEKRWGRPSRELPPDHPAWEWETKYLAQALSVFTCSFAPVKIIVGGGVMHSMNYQRLQAGLAELLNGYMGSPEIAPPALGEDAGILGALALAQDQFGS